MLRLKDTDLPLPTNAHEVSFAAFEAYREGNLVEFFKLQTGANPDLYPDLIIAYAAACAELIKHVIEVAEVPRQEVVFNDRVYSLPNDLGDESARKFWAHSLATNEIESLCAYIDATPDEVKSAPYYVVRQLLLFFSALQTSLDKFSKQFQASRPMRMPKPLDLSNYRIGKDGVEFSPTWLDHNSISKLN